jgi:hypothetical protein
MAEGANMPGKDFWFILRLILVIARALLGMAPDDPENPVNGGN